MATQPRLLMIWDLRGLLIVQLLWPTLVRSSSLFCPMESCYPQMAALGVCSPPSWSWLAQLSPCFLNSGQTANLPVPGMCLSLCSLFSGERRTCALFALPGALPPPLLLTASKVVLGQQLLHHPGTCWKCTFWALPYNSCLRLWVWGPKICFTSPHLENHCTAAMILKLFYTLLIWEVWERQVQRATLQNNSIMSSRGGPRNQYFKISSGDSNHLASWVSSACLGLHGTWYFSSVMLMSIRSLLYASRTCLSHHGTTGWWQNESIPALIRRYVRLI